MVSVAEASGQQSSLQAVLDTGVEILSNRQTVTFTLYNRVALSNDGTVFWVKSATTLTVSGSLHYSADRLQEEDQTIAANHVILTAEQQITEFNLIAPGQMYIGSWPVAGGSETIEIAFGQRADYYGPANLWHYSGFAVYPALQAQIVASSADVPTGPIVSNSLPIWLAFPAWLAANTQFGFLPASAPAFYPSFLVPDNIVPPYVSVHIDPSATEAVQQFPVTPYTGQFQNFLFGTTSFGQTIFNSAGYQLARDRVRLTLYGLSNQTVQQLYNSIIAYSEMTALFGFANAPIIRDEKRIQREIAAVAQKKTIDILANYNQGAAIVCAQQVILNALDPTLTLVPA